MRVAVEFPKAHPNHPGAVVAYRLGRVVDGVHNHYVHTGETVPLDEFLAGLVEQAKAEYPDAKSVRIERLVESEDDPTVGVWIPASQFRASKHVPLGAGRVIDREVHATSEQTGAS